MRNFRTFSKKKFHCTELIVLECMKLKRMDFVGLTEWCWIQLQFLWKFFNGKYFSSVHEKKHILLPYIINLEFFKIYFLDFYLCWMKLKEMFHQKMSSKTSISTNLELDFRTAVVNKILKAFFAFGKLAFDEWQEIGSLEWYAIHDNSQKQGWRLNIKSTITHTTGQPNIDDSTT